MSNHVYFDLSTILETLKEPHPTLQHSQQISEPAVRPKRCCMEGCKKKLLLTDCSCKCGKIYCSMHRLSEMHNCTYDYKSIGKEQLAKAMPNITAKKIDVI